MPPSPAKRAHRPSVLPNASASTKNPGIPAREDSNIAPRSNDKHRGQIALQLPDSPALAPAKAVSPIPKPAAESLPTPAAPHSRTTPKGVAAAAPERMRPPAPIPASSHAQLGFPRSFFLA